MQSDLRLRNILTILFIITGSASYFTSKMQNIQIVQAEEGIKDKKFFHPYMQTLCMFIGEFGCLLVFFFMRWRNPTGFKERETKALEEGKKPIKIMLVLIPASCDFLASAMAYIAMNFIPGSVYQMLKGGGLITTAIFSYLLLKKKIQRNHISGCVLALAGITIVGASNLIFNGASASSSETALQILGYILMLTSLTFNGFFYSYEQKLFNTYHIEPIQMVGLEGVFGIIYCLIFIPILTFIPCPFQTSSCVFDTAGDKFFERPEMFFKEIGNIPVLAAMIPLGILAVGSFNINGLMITKYINALARSLLNMTKTVVIWGIGILVTVTAGANGNKQYQWEKTNPWGITVQSFGFILLVLATLIYNENIRIPFLSQPKAKEIEEKSLLGSDSNS